MLQHLLMCQGFKCMLLWVILSQVLCCLSISMCTSREVAGLKSWEESMNRDDKGRSSCSEVATQFGRPTIKLMVQSWVTCSPF